jgi:hypothetical protein
MIPNWLKLEQNEAKRDGAVSIKNSGRGLFKGDARLFPFTVDYKFSAKSFALNKLVWSKVCNDAATNQLDIPALKVVLGGEDEEKTRLWVIDDRMFKEMLEAWKEAQ